MPRIYLLHVKIWIQVGERDMHSREKSKKLEPHKLSLIELRPKGLFEWSQLMWRPKLVDKYCLQRWAPSSGMGFSWADSRHYVIKNTKLFCKLRMYKKYSWIVENWMFWMGKILNFLQVGSWRDLTAMWLRAWTLQPHCSGSTLRFTTHQLCDFGQPTRPLCPSAPVSVKWGYS